MKAYQIEGDLTTASSNVIQLQDGMTLKLSINKDNISDLIEHHTHTKKYIKAGNYMNFTEHSQKLTPYDVKLTNPYVLITDVKYTNNKIPVFIQKIWNWFKFKFELEVNTVYKEE